MKSTHTTRVVEVNLADIVGAEVGAVVEPDSLVARDDGGLTVGREGGHVVVHYGEVVVVCPEVVDEVETVLVEVVLES